MRIQQIRLKNFKTFKEEEVLKVDGKNLLICGNNGSGKSSLHYALHVFFRSSTKGDHYKKYFIDPTDRVNGTESLLNVYGDAREYLVELLIKKNDNTTVRFQIKEPLDPGAESHQHSDIQLSDFASDFISHGLLVNFYNFRNSQDANIWPLFRREVFPYWKSDTKHKTFEVWLNEIMADFDQLSQVRELELQDDFLTDDTGGGQKRKRKYDRTSPEYKAIQARVAEFNDAFVNFYNSIKDRINDILNEFLPEEQLEVSLEYKMPLDADAAYEWLWNTPELIVRLKSNGTDIAKPHVFLNEGRLTALALSIRLAMFDMKFKGTGGDVIKLLVLDDLLVSLDMDFRMRLIRYVQQQQGAGGSFHDYQLFILTHDKSLFHVLKNTLARDVKKWKWFEFFENNTYPIASSADYKNPVIIEDKDLLTIATEYLTGIEKDSNQAITGVKAKNYELCALFLRKRIEQLLKLYFDPQMEQLYRLKVLENLDRGLGAVEKEWTQKRRQAFERLFEKQIDADRLAELKALELVAATDALQVGRGAIRDANAFKNAIYSYLEEYHKEFAEHQDRKKGLIRLSKALQEIKGRILNHGAHANDEIIYELELRGAIEAVREFENSIIKMNKRHD